MLSRIPKDKLLHLGAGIIITFLTMMVSGNVAYGLVAGFGAGAVKEGYDWLHNWWRARKGLPPVHDADLLDFVYTAMGSIAGAVLSVVLAGLPAYGQTRYLVKPICLPLSPNDLTVKSNEVGVCASFTCLGNVQPVKVYKYTYCGAWSEMPKIPGRIATMRNAADPLTSLQTLGNRIMIHPITDPSMRGMPIE